MQSLVTNDNFVITSSRVAVRFEGRAVVGNFVMLLLATQRLDIVRGVLIWDVLSRMLVTWHFLNKGFLYNFETTCLELTEKH